MNHIELQNKWYGNKALLIFLDIYPRYAGPREAIFTAQCRKNLLLILLLEETILAFQIFIIILIHLNF